MPNGVPVNNEKLWKDMLVDARRLNSWHYNNGRYDDYAKKSMYYSLAVFLNDIKSDPVLEYSFNNLFCKRADIPELIGLKATYEKQTSILAVSSEPKTLSYKLPSKKELYKMFYLADIKPDYAADEKAIRTAFDNMSLLFSNENTAAFFNSMNPLNNDTLEKMKLLFRTEKDSRDKKKTFHEIIEQNEDRDTTVNKINDEIIPALELDIKNASAANGEINLLTTVTALYNKQMRGASMTQEEQAKAQKYDHYVREYQLIHKLKVHAQSYKKNRTNYAMINNGIRFPDRTRLVTDHDTIKERRDLLTYVQTQMSQTLKGTGHSNEWKAMYQALVQMQNTLNEHDNREFDHAFNMRSSMELLKYTAQNYIKHKVETSSFDKGKDFARLKVAKNLENFAAYDLKQLESVEAITKRMGQTYYPHTGSQEAKNDALFQQHMQAYHFREDLDTIRTKDSTEYTKLCDALDRFYNGLDTGAYANKSFFQSGSEQLQLLKYHNALDEVLKCANAYLDYKKTHNNGDPESAKRIGKVLQIRDYFSDIAEKEDEYQVSVNKESVKKENVNKENDGKIGEFVVIE